MSRFRLGCLSVFAKEILIPGEVLKDKVRRTSLGIEVFVLSMVFV